MSKDVNTPGCHGRCVKIGVSHWFMTLGCNMGLQGSLLAAAASFPPFASIVVVPLPCITITLPFVAQVSLMPDAVAVNSRGGAIFAVLVACTFYGTFRHMQDRAPKQIQMAAFGVSMPRQDVGLAIIDSHALACMCETELRTTSCHADTCGHVKTRLDMFASTVVRSMRMHMQL